MSDILARLDRARKEREIAQLEADHARLVKELPQALINKEKALVEIEASKASGKFFDCDCGTGRTELCERPLCEYERIRQGEYVFGYIYRAEYLENKIAEIAAELERRKA